MLFSHPAMLWGLMAILIPIAIHLFNFRRYRKVYFSNVDRLAGLQSESRRRSNLRRWLVLAMRILAIVMLVFAFAGPVLKRDGATIRTGSTVVSVFIDNSFSMDGTSHDGSQLEQARRKAREIVAAYSPSDRFQLLTGDMVGSQMRWLSRDEFLSALDAVEVSPAVRSISQVASRQAAFLSQSGSPNRHAYIISDFQQSICNLDNLPSDSTLRFTFVPLSNAGTDNIYIDTIRLDAPAYFVGGSVAVEVTIANGGSHDVDKLPVKLYVDGRERAMSTLDLAAGASGTTTLLFTIDAPGWHDGRVEISDYPITYDDNYHFTLSAGQPVGVLEVDGREANPSLARLFSADSAVSFVRSKLLSQQQAQEASLIILNEPRQLASGDAAWLTEWVNQGGSLLVIPAADVIPSELNAMLASMQAPQLGSWLPRKVNASGIDYGSSLYRNVFSGRSDEMELPTLQGHYALSASQAVRQSIITLADGGDMLTLTPFGNGRLYLLTVPLSSDYTDLVSQALFVPTLYNMALYSRPQPIPCYTLGTLEPIALQQQYDPLGNTPELQGDKNFSIVPDLRLSAGRQTMVLHNELPTDGIYSLADEHLAFNYGRRESQLSFLTPAELSSAISNIPSYSLLQPTERPLDQVIRDRESGHRLWRWCLILALLALAVEGVILRGGKEFFVVKEKRRKGGK